VNATYAERLLYYKAKEQFIRDEVEKYKAIFGESGK
jgi:hypothetical protein